MDLLLIVIAWVELKAEGRETDRKKARSPMGKMGLRGIVRTTNCNLGQGTAPGPIVEGYVGRDGQTHHKNDFSCGGPDEKRTAGVSRLSFL